MARAERKRRLSTRRRRRGSIYIVVVGVAMIVSVLALGAILVRRIERRTSQGTADVAEARTYALAAIEIGRLRIKNDSDWRNTYSNGVWEADVPIGSGTYTLEGIDPDDGVLNNGADHPLVLIGTGEKGLARQKMQVRLVAEVRALDCLSAAIHAGGNFTVNSGTTISATGGPVSTNSELANSGTVDGDVEANSVSGSGTITGTTTVPAPAKEMPDSSVFDFYTDPANGTYIDVTSIPLSSGFRYLETQVLSPNSNPYGTQDTNPQGIYVIDCMGEKLAIQNCRIVGTLVLLNAGGVSEVYTVNWEPAVANYPALLVQGDVDFYINSGNILEEGPPLSFNFNPPGTPYLDVDDEDTDDTYPVVIKGLVYVSGAVETWQSPAFDGVVVVGNTMTANTSLNLTYRSTFLNDPPPGFEAPVRMKIATGSFQQVVD